MFFGITRKLLSGFALASVVLVVTMTGSIYWYLNDGLKDSLQQVEIQGTQSMAEALTHAYSTHGSWDFLRHKLTIWGFFLNYLPGGVWANRSPEEIIDVLKRQPPPSGLPLLEEAAGNTPPPRYAAPTGPDREQRHPQQRLRPNRHHKPAPDSSSLTYRLNLLDKNKHLLLGIEEQQGEPTLVPLVVHNETIGYLSIYPVSWMERAFASHLQKKQLIGLVISGTLALVVSLLIGLPLGRTLLAPIKKLGTGVQQLAQGNFSTRIHDGSKDELGQLINNVNTLASFLEDSEHLRRSMMADISHELRTPLSVMRAEIETIQDGIRPCNQEQLESLHLSVANMSRMVDDLYDLSLSDGGNLAYHMQEVDIAALLARVSNKYEPLLRQKAISLNTHGTDKKVVILGDPDRLTQVFNNILKNSSRYTDPDGAVHIQLAVENNMVRITLKDSYPGVSEHDRDNLFNRFYRVDKSRSRALGGAGLGLALCHSIITAHQGSVSASNSNLGGLQIDIVLPQVK